MLHLPLPSASRVTSSRTDRDIGASGQDVLTAKGANYRTCLGHAEPLHCQDWLCNGGFIIER
jgi:hypothetical protein